MNAGHALLLALLATACSPAPRPEEPAASSEAPTATVAPPDQEKLAAQAALSAAMGGQLLQEAPLEVQTHTIDAKVKSVTPFGQNPGRVFIIDSDARFVIELELMGVAPAMADDPPGSALVAGKTVAFAVHSPAKVFKSDGDMVGKRMHFSVTRTRTKNSVEIGALQVE